MFEELGNVPAHALLVHAAVVFVPLLSLGAIVYAVMPSLRERIGWAVALLAVTGPVAALFARFSGEELAEALARKGYPPQILSQVAEHGEYGDLTFWSSLALSLATGLLLFVTSGHPRARDLPAPVGRGLVGLVVVLGGLAAVYVFLTGDTGAKAVWTGVL